MKLEIYTDGSHFKGPRGSGRLGIGGVLVKNGTVLSKFSTEITKQYLKLYYGTDDCSNPTMEMLAVLYALYNFKDELKNASSVEFKMDYMGVREWMTGKWKINKPYILKIKNDIDEEIKNLGLKGKVSFKWIKSHQRGDDPDIVFNNMVDILAKGESV